MLLVSNNLMGDQEAKARLPAEFEMKDLGGATKILRIDIIRDMEKWVLKYHKKYIDFHQKRKVHWESIYDVPNEQSKRDKYVFGSQFRLCGLSEEGQRTYMFNEWIFLYANAVGSLKYVMVG